jgi:hypothetical protein
MDDVGTLPPEYADLQPFMADWCLSNERDRYFKLVSSSLPELQRFFDAIAPRSDEITTRLMAMDVEKLSVEDKNLFWLLMTYVETAHPIELKWKKTDVEDSFSPERLQFGPSSCESPV